MADERKQVGNGEWDVPPKPLGEVPQRLWKCNQCTRLLFVGELGSGTHIEVLCHYCKSKSQFFKP